MYEQLREVWNELTAPSAPFEITQVDVRGVPVKAFAGAPPSLRALWLGSAAHGDKDYLVYENERWTYEDAHREVNAIAGWLAGQGVEPGDRVAIAMRNYPEWMLAYWATVSMGAAAVGINAWWTGPEIVYGVQDATPKVMICDTERLERFLPHASEAPACKLVGVRMDDALPEGVTPWSALRESGGSLPDLEIDPDSDACIFYTSGTTGRPKGAQLTHRGCVNNVFSLAFANLCQAAAIARAKGPGASASDAPAPQLSSLVTTPLFHVTANNCVVGALVTNFSHFHPVGVVLVAMLGIGVAEHTGFINAGLRAMMAVTARWLLTPMLILVGIVSHSAVDAGYVLVIPLGGVIFYAAGRHPLAGIAAAFAGVSGGFSANFVPSALDPMLQGISQAGAQILDPGVVLNPLNNYFFTTVSSVLIVGLGWFLTDRVVEPRLQSSELDGDLTDLPHMKTLEPNERRALTGAVVAMLLGIAVMVLTSLPAGSAWRAPDGNLASGAAPLMRSIVPLIFLLFLIPGVVYGVMSGSIKTSRDMIEGMSKAMTGMGYYLVIMFFIAQFIYAFGQSNLGVLMALKGAAGLKALAMPAPITITGIVFLTGFINLFVGSASAKWALLAPIFIPMLMQLGISPDLAQAAYRVGDSSTNIITPLMPYFPLVVVFCQRYVKNTGIGTVTAMMLPYSVTFIVLWTLFLLGYWALGLPLGLQSSYTYG